MSDSIRAMHTFQRAAYAVQLVARAALADMRLDPTVYALLDYIATSNQATPKGFKGFNGGTNPSYFIKQSLDNGLITGVRHDEDSRVKILSLTPRGREVHLEATARIDLFLSSKDLNAKLKEFADSGNADSIICISEATALSAERILKGLRLPEKNY